MDRPLGLCGEEETLRPINCDFMIGLNRIVLISDQPGFCFLHDEWQFSGSAYQALPGPAACEAAPSWLLISILR